MSALHAQMTSLVNASLGIPTHLVPSDDGRFVFFLRAHPRDARQSLWETDLATGETRELLRPDALGAEPENLSPEELTRRERQRISASGFTSFQVAHDTIIVPLSGRLYALTRASGKVRELATGAGAAVDPQLSPDGTEVAYVRDYDVHVLALEEGAHERAVTQGGTEMRSNGLAEHIAQEELFRSRGFWWSPDGRHILYEEADLSPVQRLSIADPTHPERAPTLRAYPRAGTPNAIVRLAMAKVPSHAAEPPRRVTWDIARYPYLAAVAWTANAPPTIYVLDRVQQTGVLLTIDPATGETHTLHTEHDAIWLNVDPSVPRWLPDGSGFLWSTERHGAWELELRDPGGDLRETIVPAHLGYRELLALDANCVYVSACSDPTRSEVWAAALDGSARQPVARLEGGVVSARFNGAGDVYAFSEGTKLGERRFGARATDDSWQVQIASLADPLPFTPKVEYTTVGEEAFHVAIIRPRHFDPARRYPLIDAVYGGPHHNMVTADAVTYLRHQWIADVADAIVVAIDAHGTMWRGRDWERKLRDRIGDVPLEGHVAAIRALAKRYSEIDATRVGIYGWSFGGYLSSLAILRRPDVFKVGAAGAPVVDQADYDTCYTERYLGIPPNPAFERASLLTWAARPPSASSPARPFFLTHGTIDDNVLFANSLKLVNTMVKAGRPVEFVPLVGVTHMLTSPEIASPVWTRIALFLRDHL